MAKIDIFYQSMASLLEDYAEYLEYEKIGRVSRGIRVNTLKIAINELFSAPSFAEIAAQMRGSGFAPESFSISAQATKHPYYFAGLYYSQEPSASCTIEALRPYIGVRVLDMCAAPGGKATQAAAAMQGRGILVANEIVYGRAKILRGNIERAGIRNAMVVNNTPEELADRYGGYFDTVIVDAPCSGEGMFLKEPQAKDMWSAEYVEECAARQLQILYCADRCLTEGGYLVYSTCTFNMTENERVAAEFAARHGYSFINIGNIANCSRGFGLTEAIRIFPHRHGGLGHFVALMRKESPNGRAPAKLVNPFKEIKGGTAEKAFDELAAARWGELREYNGGIYVLPEELPVARGINILSAGVKAFDIVNGSRLEPHHALAMAVRKGEALRTVECDIAAALRYLSGETLPAEHSLKGYAFAAIDGYPLGLVKISDGIAKNRLPKGLRLNKI